jgi:putative transposase
VPHLLSREAPLLVSIAYVWFCLLAELALIPCRHGRTRDIDLLARRHEVRVLRRQARRTAWQPGDRRVLAALSRCPPRAAWGVLPVRPGTLLRWHRELVRRTWAAFGRRRGPGRPPLPADLRGLIGRLATENPRRGYQRIRRELLTLGHDVSATAIRTTLRWSGCPAGAPPGRAVLGHGPPRPCRSDPRVRLRHGGDRPLADVARAVLPRGPHAEGVRRRLHGSPDRRAGGPAGPQPALAARRGGLPADAADPRPRRRVPGNLDEVFGFEGARVGRAPYRAPRARAHADRWVGTVRRECLDWLLIVGERHLQRVLRDYVDHCNTARPHRAHQLRPRVPHRRPRGATGAVVRRDRLGGLIREYEPQAA